MALELNAQGLAAVAALAEARTAAAAAEKAAKEAAAAVKALLGDESEGTVAGVLVVEIQTVERHGIDTAVLKAEYPEVAAKVDKVTTYEKVVLA
jgi:predicted phage-related endonuclease